MPEIFGVLYETAVMMEYVTLHFFRPDQRRPLIAHPIGRRAVAPQWFTEPFETFKTDIMSFMTTMKTDVEAKFLVMDEKVEKLTSSFESFVERNQLGNISISSSCIINELTMDFEYSCHISFAQGLTTLMTWTRIKWIQMTSTTLTFPSRPGPNSCASTGL